MNKVQKIVLGLLVVACLGLGVYYVEKPTVLKLGVFTGSSWDVPSSENGKFIDRLVRRFEKTHPNVEVEYVSGIVKSEYSKWLSNKALTGDLPDVYMVLSDDVSTFANVGMLMPLDEWIEEDEDFHVSKYYKTSYQSGQSQGVQYALPYESVPTLMFVNRTMLEANGIQEIDPNWTWEDFYTLCSRLSQDTDGDGRIDQFGEYGYSWQHALSSNDAKLFNEDGTKVLLEDEKVVEALDFMRQLEGLRSGQSVTSDLFEQGRVAFCPMRFSEYRTYQPYPWSVKKYSTFTWDCVPMPAGPHGSNASEMDTLLFGVSRNTEKQDLAWDFLKLVSYDPQTQRELFRYSQGVSVLKAVSTSKTVQKQMASEMPEGQNVHLDYFEDVMKQAIVIKKFNGYDTAYSIIDSEFQRLIDSQDDIENSLNDLSDEVRIGLENK